MKTYSLFFVHALQFTIFLVLLKAVRALQADQKSPFLAMHGKVMHMNEQFVVTRFVCACIREFRWFNLVSLPCPCIDP